MLRIKVMLAGLLAMLVVGSVATTSASAQTQGPWWRHPESAGSQKQVKWPINEEHAITSANEGAFELKGKLLLMATTLRCNTVENEGKIWNGLHQGEDEAEVKFTNCSVVLPAGCSTAAVEVEPVKVYTEQMWKYRGESKELTEAGGPQQKIYDVFAPKVAPNAEGKALFTNIKITGTVCAGTYPVQAAGTRSTFIDQNQAEHEVVWGTAAQVEPQNEDVVTGHLKWTDPNVKKLHHQETPIEAKLLFGGEPAELQGRIKIELVSKEPFGDYNI